MFNNKIEGYYMKRYNRKPSQNPPGNLEPKNVPQFVSLGFDDNEMIDELNWISDFAKKLKNRDGSPVTFTFYNNGKFKNTIPTWKKLYLDGHEIGDHTFSHCQGQSTDWNATPPTYKVLMDSNQWKEEMIKNKEVYDNAGIDDVVGFRTPYLEYTDETFKASYSRGFKYDCSIEEGYQKGHSPRNYNWPYTLDNGSPGDTVISETVPDRQPIGKYPGFWEMPVYLFEIPDDSHSGKYDFPSGLRDRVVAGNPFVINSDWKLTGFDWNIWHTEEGELYLQPDEFLAILKYNLDLHLNGNRTPFMLGTHIDLYTPKERKVVLEKFIKYALSKKEVIITSTRNILDWIENPKPLND